MHILADADALPAPIRDILFRAALRLSIPLTLVANKRLSVPESPLIRAVRVGQGFDVVDEAIVDMVQPGDLVVTADIPLAARVVAKKAHALDPRGELHDENSIQGRLAMRNLLMELRDSGVVTGGPPPLSQSHRQAFANQLDRFLRDRTREA